MVLSGLSDLAVKKYLIQLFQKPSVWQDKLHSWKLGVCPTVLCHSELHQRQGSSLEAQLLMPLTSNIWRSSYLSRAQDLFFWLMMCLNKAMRWQGIVLRKRKAARVLLIRSVSISLFPRFSNENNNCSYDMLDCIFQKLYNFKLSII